MRQMKGTDLNVGSYYIFRKSQRIKAKLVKFMVYLSAWVNRDELHRPKEAMSSSFLRMTPLPMVPAKVVVITSGIFCPSSLILSLYLHAQISV